MKQFEFTAPDGSKVMRFAFVLADYDSLDDKFGAIEKFVCDHFNGESTEERYAELRKTVHRGVHRYYWADQLALVTTPPEMDQNGIEWVYMCTLLELPVALVK